MLFAEWKGKRVVTYNELRQQQRIHHMPDEVVSVQCTGRAGDDNARVAITMANGRTRIYDCWGRLIR